MKKMTNNFSVSGYVAVDATVKNFETTSVARFPISISRLETINGQEVRKSALTNIEAWRKNDNLSELVTVEGYFRPEEWTDKDNKKQNRIVMNATKVYLTPEKE